MAYDIRPLSFSEILDRAFRVLLDNFATLLAIAAPVLIPVRVLLASRSVFGNHGTILIALVFVQVAGPVMHAALIVAVASAYLNLQTSVAEAYKSVRPILLPFIGTYFVYALAFVVVGIIVGYASGRALSAPSFPAKSLFVAGALATTIVGGYFLVGCSFIGSAMVIERRFGWPAARRSRELVAGVWWHTLGILLTAFLLANAPAAALRFVWGFIPVIGPVLSGATQSVSVAYGVAALVIYYFDRRCRTEDFDLRLLAEQVRAEAQTTIATASDSSALA